MHAVIDVTLGLFVGGASRRMGGQPKGLLTIDGERLVDRGIRLAEELGMAVVLVGDHVAYRDIGPTTLADSPAGVGPIGGLAALVRHAETARVIAMAVDMPYVQRADLELLVRTAAQAAAPRRDDRWEPMLAIYDRRAAREAIEAQLRHAQHSLQDLLDRLDATAVSLPDRHLHDWDSPDDLPA